MKLMSKHRFTLIAHQMFISEMAFKKQQKYRITIIKNSHIRWVVFRLGGLEKYYSFKS